VYALKIGYARVSTQDQNLDRQLDNLKNAGCERIFNEKMTGTKSDRPELKTMLLTLRQGDILVIDSFSRLSRSTKDLLDLVDRLTGMGVHLVSLKENLDTTTATGKLMLTMLSALSQFERDLIAERTVDGLKAARARGRCGGRPKVGTDRDRQQALAMYKANVMSCSDIAKRFGVSLSTLNRWIAKEKAETV
jgi:DNA invertase Pin-like site-specific DNA recombinase